MSRTWPLWTLTSMCRYAASENSTVDKYRTTGWKCNCLHQTLLFMRINAFKKHHRYNDAVVRQQLWSCHIKWHQLWWETCGLTTDLSGFLIQPFICCITQQIQHITHTSPNRFNTLHTHTCKHTHMQAHTQTHTHRRTLSSGRVCVSLSNDNHTSSAETSVSGVTLSL